MGIIHEDPPLSRCVRLAASESGDREDRQNHRHWQHLGSVFEDANRNGVRDAGEAPLASVDL